MKKTFRNIRTLAALLMAGAAFAACSSSDDNAIEQQPANSGEQVYTLTVNATKDGGSQTRALNLDGEKLVASWETTDYIAVINKTKSYSPSGSLKPTNISADGNSATLTGTVEGVVAEGDDLILTYHFHSISDFADQNGMLNGNAKSAEAYDQAEATVTVASIDGSGNITTTADASFTTQTAMIKFTLQDNAATPNKINATSLNVKATITLPAPLSTITEDLFTFTIDPVVYTYNGYGTLYYALPSAATLAGPIATKLQADPYNLTITESYVVTLLASTTVTFTASDGVNTYVATKTGYPFTAGKYYTTTLTMAKPAASKALSAVTASELGWRLGNDGVAYSPTGALPAGVTAEAIIAHVGAVTNYCDKFIAIALDDVDTSLPDWSTALTKVNTYAGNHPITIGGTKYNTNTTGSPYYDQVTPGTSTSSATATSQQTGWRLPSVTDWRYIFQGLCSGPSATSPVGVADGGAYGTGSTLQSAINTACGNTAIGAFGYWSSSAHNSIDGYVWIYKFDIGQFVYGDGTGGSRVRAVFAY